MTYHFLYSKISYGDAIHLARIMAATFSDQDYSVHDDCIALPQNRNKQESYRTNDITVFPNPSTGLVYVSLPEKYVGNCTVFNHVGQLLWLRKLDGDRQVTIDLADQKGINLLHFLSDGGSVKVIKVVIVK